MDSNCQETTPQSLSIFSSPVVLATLCETSTSESVFFFFFQLELKVNLWQSHSVAFEKQADLCLAELVGRKGLWNDHFRWVSNRDGSKGWCMICADTFRSCPEQLRVCMCKILNLVEQKDGPKRSLSESPLKKQKLLTASERRGILSVHNKNWWATHSRFGLTSLQVSTPRSPTGSLGPPRSPSRLQRGPHLFRRVLSRNGDVFHHEQACESVKSISRKLSFHQWNPWVGSHSNTCVSVHTQVELCRSARACFLLFCRISSVSSLFPSPSLSPCCFPQGKARSFHQATDEHPGRHPINRWLRSAGSLATVRFCRPFRACLAYPWLRPIRCNMQVNCRRRLLIFFFFFFFFWLLWCMDLSFRNAKPNVGFFFLFFCFVLFCGCSGAWTYLSPICRCNMQVNCRQWQCRLFLFFLWLLWCMDLSFRKLMTNQIMDILDEKVNAHLPHYSTLKKFWNGFFQTFQAGLLFFSGGKHCPDNGQCIQTFDLV